MSSVNIEELQKMPKCRVALGSRTSLAFYTSTKYQCLNSYLAVLKYHESQTIVSSDQCRAVRGDCPLEDYVVNIVCKSSILTHFEIDLRPFKSKMGEFPFTSDLLYGIYYY